MQYWVIFTPLCIYSHSVAVIHKSNITLFTFFPWFFFSLTRCCSCAASAGSRGWNAHCLLAHDPFHKQTWFYFKSRFSGMIPSTSVPSWLQKRWREFVQSPSWFGRVEEVFDQGLGALRGLGGLCCDSQGPLPVWAHWGLILNEQWGALLHPHTHPGRLQQPQFLRVSPGLK